jgi:hypothetical protein
VVVDQPIAVVVDLVTLLGCDWRTMRVAVVAVTTVLGKPVSVIVEARSLVVDESIAVLVDSIRNLGGTRMDPWAPHRMVDAVIASARSAKESIGVLVARTIRMCLKSAEQ